MSILLDVTLFIVVHIGFLLESILSGRFGPLSGYLLETCSYIEHERDSLSSRVASSLLGSTAFNQRWQSTGSAPRS